MISLLALTACGGSRGNVPLVYRVDGQPVVQADDLVCQGERAKTIGSAVALNPYARQEAGYVVYRGCMAERGYVVN